MTPEERAARERKQKIFVGVGGLFLVALLAIQLPKLLGGSSSPEATATTTNPTTRAGEQSAPSASPVALVGAETGKISSLSAFEPKDPFVQQVVTQNGVGAGTEGEGESKSTGTGGGSEKTAKFATGKTTAAAVTIVTVNGARQVLEPGMKFPVSDPLFVLVAENPGSKSVVVGISGGAYSGGAKTTRLEVGKPLTLVNTTTGARYKLALVSVGSGDAASDADDAPKP